MTPLLTHLNAIADRLDMCTAEGCKGNLEYAPRIAALLRALRLAIEQRNLYAGEDPIYFDNSNFASQESLDDAELLRLFKERPS